MSIQKTRFDPGASLDNSTTTCEVCRGIWSCFLDPTADREVMLGFAGDPMLPGCPGHSPLFNYCSKGSKTTSTERSDTSDSSEDEDANTMGHSRHTGDGGWTEIVTASQIQSFKSLRAVRRPARKRVEILKLKTGKYSSAYHLALLKRDSIPDHPGTGVALDPKWIDLRLARGWKKRCLEQHGTKCDNPFKVSSVKPFWVVDVESECIVPGRDCDAFVALSYRWGNHSWPKVTKEILATLRKPASLVTAHVAPIVRHAMSVTSLIGERYLWVDALCIIQDDSADTVHQLNLMGAFYASALITIVAAEGDSVEGILGLKGVSSPLRARQTLIPFGEEKLVFPKTSINLGRYQSRGWTYQEYIMSQRRLIFADGKIHWDCQCCNWHEEVVCSSEVYPNALHKDPMYRPSKILRGLPDIESFMTLMSDYNLRSFSYDEDVIPGISGILALFSRSFQGGFLCGLPEMFFDKALGWCGGRDSRRRKPSERPEKDRLMNSPRILPSWSWVGWEGRVTDGIMRPEEAIRISNLSPDNPVEEAIPVTDWFTSDSAKGTHLRKIQSTWFENRDDGYKDFTKPLPEGWTRRKAKDVMTRREDESWCPPGCNEYAFEHRLFPGNYYYYPFPITEGKESTPQFMPEQTPYLFCKTQMARLWAVCSVDLWEEVAKRSPLYGLGLPNDIELQVLEIRTECSGPAVGELYLHSVDQLTPFLIASNEYIKAGPGQSVELVAIYRSIVHEQYSIESAVTSERYRVLWVEWENGIAYRLGVGWVERGAWERLNRTEIDLVLG